VGSGSGGDFAIGRYIKPRRSIELHVRFVLGIVLYRIGDQELKHQDLMACLGIPRERVSYPGYSEEPTDSFRHLRMDLEGPLRGILDGSIDDGFRECVHQQALTDDRSKRWLP
jgi:hypothetical protein